MDWVYISDVGQHEGQDVQLKGWLYNKRSSGKLHFLQVRDGTGVIQAVVSRADVPAEAFEAASRLTQESSVVVSGRVRADEHHGKPGLDAACDELCHLNRHLVPNALRDGVAINQLSGQSPPPAAPE